MQDKEVARGAAADQSLFEQSKSLKSGMGAVAWAVLEMFRRGGMDHARVAEIHAEMNKYFPNPSNDECNAILTVVEKRLVEDKVSEADWYE